MSPAPVPISIYGVSQDLYDHVLFNYKWLYAKSSALPLNELLSDFEDAVNNIEDAVAVKEINLVADSIRLGGAILKYYPEMLAAQVSVARRSHAHLTPAILVQLNGRLLPERQTSRNIRSLLQQCDEEVMYDKMVFFLEQHCLDGRVRTTNNTPCIVQCIDAV